MIIELDLFYSWNDATSCKISIEILNTGNVMWSRKIYFELSVDENLLDYG